MIFLEKNDWAVLISSVGSSWHLIAVYNLAFAYHAIY